MFGQPPETGVFSLFEEDPKGGATSAFRATLSWNGQLSCAQHFAALCTTAQRTLQNHRRRNPGAVLWTPMLRSYSLGSSVFVKLESEQVTNSFKVRGAINRVQNAGAKHIVAASTGNHALAVVHAINLLALEGTMFLPQNVSQNKLSALQRFAEGGKCEIQLTGKDCLEAELAASNFAKQREAVYVSPYNDELVIAGQGTIGFEILEYLRMSYPLYAGRKKCCYVTIGGGGLVAGVSAVLKANQPGQWRVVGCLPQNSPVMFECMKTGRICAVPCKETLSDGSAGQIEQNAITFEACSHLVDAWAIVSEEEIRLAMRDVLAFEHKLVEGSAGVAVAGMRRDSKWRDANDCVASVVIACGGNVSVDTILKVTMGTPG
ncbi:unnamed protein product [Agarophyton chilense]